MRAEAREIRIDERGNDEQRHVDTGKQDEECSSKSPSVGALRRHPAYPGATALLGTSSSSCRDGPGGTPARQEAGLNRSMVPLGQSKLPARRPRPWNLTTAAKTTTSRGRPRVRAPAGLPARVSPSVAWNALSAVLALFVYPRPGDRHRRVDHPLRSRHVLRDLELGPASADRAEVLVHLEVLEQVFLHVL